MQKDLVLRIIIALIFSAYTLCYYYGTESFGIQVFGVVVFLVLFFRPEIYTLIWFLEKKYQNKRGDNDKR